MRFITDYKKGILGKPDPVEVWEQIVSHISDETLLKDDFKVLVFACGHATEADLLVKRMSKLGIATDKIKNSIHLLDLYKVFTKEAERRGYVNVVTADFLEYNTDVQFDAILSNPPYAAKTNPSEKAWAVMAEHAVKFLKPNGILSCITPVGWMKKPKGQRFVRLTDLFVQYNLLHVDTTINKHFETGETVGYWVMSKTTDKSVTSVVTPDATAEIMYNGDVIAVTEQEQLAVSVSNKLLNTDYSQIKNYAYKDMRNHKPIAGLIEIGHMAEEQSEHFDTEVYYIPSRRYWMPKESVKQTWKLILNLTSYYGSPNQSDETYNPISDSLGIGINAFGIPADTKEQCENIKSYVFSKLYRFYMENNRSSNFNLHVRDLPYLGFDKKYTDQELYTLFGLTEKEQIGVEKYIDSVDNKGKE